MPDISFIRPVLDTSFMAAIISPTTVNGSPRDAWGHIKVPRIEHYERTSSPEDEGWYKTENGNLEAFSSFVGIPMGGMDSVDFIDYSVTIQPAYFHLVCDEYFGELESAFNKPRWLGHVYWQENITERAKLSPDNDKPFEFVISTDEFRVSNCTVETVYVEAEITCHTHDTCAVSRVRRSLLAHPPAAYTQLGPLIGYKNTPWESALAERLDEMGTIDGNDDFNGDDEVAETDTYGAALVSQYYITDPQNIMGRSTNEPSEVSSETFALRLSQILNAYWAIMNGKNAIPGRFDESANLTSTNVSWYYQDETRSLDDESADNVLTLAKAWPATGSRRSNVEVFKAHFGWVVALIVSSTVLIIASLVPFCLRTFLSHGPDVLMNFSSLATRDNPYVALPGTGTYLDAADRSRLLKDVRIRFGDVEEGGEIGRLAIGRLDGDVAPLRKGKKYA